MRKQRKTLTSAVIIAVGLLVLQCTCSLASTACAHKAIEKKSHCHSSQEQSSRHSSGSECCGQCQKENDAALSSSVKFIAQFKKVTHSFAAIALLVSTTHHYHQGIDLFHDPPSASERFTEFFKKTLSPRAPPV